MYRLTEDPNTVLRDDGALIPAGHRWWDEYQTWLAEGNTPGPAKTDEELKVEKDRAITMERDRRISAGVLFQDKLFQSRATDRENIAGAAQLALTATLRGDGAAGNYRWHGGESDFVWIAEDNSLVTMDAPTVIAFAKTAAAAKQAYTMIARSLKDLDPAPDDITDDALWQF